MSWYRVLLLFPGFGDATARSAIEAVAAEAWHPTALSHWTPPPRGRDAHAKLVALLSALCTADPLGARPVSSEIAEIRTLYDDILRDRYDKPDPRLADLDQLEIIAGQFPGRGAFLSELALEPPSATQDLSGASRRDDDCLILSTAHSAKGREWDAVFVIWAVDGWFPAARSLRTGEETEEERRLMYVAITRARHHLCVTYPLHAYSSRWGSEYSVDQLSRFIDPGVRELMERRVAYAAPEAPLATGTVVEAVMLDLRSLLRGRFGG